MANTYNWTIERIGYHSSAHGKDKVAYNLYWKYSVTDETGNFTANMGGATEIPYNPDSSYIDFDNLTHEIVVGWLEAALDSDVISSFRNQLDTLLADTISPKSVIASPPWTPTPTSN